MPGREGKPVFIILGPSWTSKPVPGREGKPDLYWGRHDDGPVLGLAWASGPKVLGPAEAGLPGLMGAADAGGPEVLGPAEADLPVLKFWTMKVQQRCWLPV